MDKGHFQSVGGLKYGKIKISRLVGSFLWPALAMCMCPRCPYCNPVAKCGYVSQAFKGGTVMYFSWWKTSFETLPFSFPKMVAFAPTEIVVMS